MSSTLKQRQHQQQQHEQPSYAPQHPPPMPARPSPLVLALVALVAASLLIPPRPQSRHYAPSRLAAPLALSLVPLPASILSTFPRAWRAARPVEHLAIAYAVVGALGAGWSAGVRFAGRGDVADERASSSTKEGGAVAPDDGVPAATGKSASPEKDFGARRGAVIGSPLLVALALHLASWRLMAAPPAGTPHDWEWPYDLATVLGLGIAACAIVAETGRLARLGGLTRGSTERMGWRRLVHAVLATHRVSLALRVLSAGLDRTPPVGLSGPP